MSPDVPSDEAAHASTSSRLRRVVRLFGAMVVSRVAFLRVGMLDERLPVGAAIDWISRAEHAGLRFAGIDDVVLRRRLHRANTGRTTSEPTAQQALHDVVRAHHQRRTGSAAHARRSVRQGTDLGAPVSEEQQLLLRAVLWSGDAAADAFARWRSVVDIEDLDRPSHRLLPLLAQRLPDLAPDDPIRR